ncbi:TrmH family RNA methyltransferase [Caulobacter mirabilis]|nr:RNA methyltransferase [Caulobacter mirabilis]
MSRLVTSHSNPTVKAVKALHMRKAREESGQFLAEGLKIVTEAVELGHAPKILLYGKDADGHPLLTRAVAATEKAGGEVIEVNREILEKIAKRDNPQAVLAVFDQRFTPLQTLEPQAAKVWVGLHRVRDPGNLGTIIRTADAAGAGGVILVGDCCDPYSVEAVRATMGSIFAVPIAKAAEAEFIAWRDRWPGSVVGTLLTATVDHKSADYRRPSLVLMGNEQAGLTPELAALCDVNVKIPMRGRADSLNLSVATGIMIYAAGD